MDEDTKLVMSRRLVPLKDADRSFDIEFWQRLGPEAIFQIEIGISCGNRVAGFRTTRLPKAHVAVKGR